MKKFVFGFLFVCCCFWHQQVSAAVPIGLPQLANRGELITYNSRRVAGGMVYVSSRLGMTQSTNSIPYVEISTNTVEPEIVLNELSKKLLRVGLNHPSNDTVYVVTYLRDAQYHALFSGQASLEPVQRPDGSWAAPTNMLNVAVSRVHDPYVYVGPETYWANLAVMSEDGTYVIGYQSFEVGEDGWMQFREDLIASGDLTLYQRGGGSVTYNLRDGGRQIDPSMIDLRVAGNMKDLITEVGETVGSYVLRPVSDQGYGHATVVKVKVTTARTIHFSGLTTEGEPAIEATAIELNTGDRKVLSIPVGGSAGFWLEPGLYQIHFVWRDGFDSFDADDYYGGPG